MDFAGRISVFGGREVAPELFQDAVTIGEQLAEHHFLVFCGGGNGVMEAVSQGVHKGGGTVIGIMKSMAADECNPYVHIPIYTNMGIGRNPLLAYNCDVALAIGGKFGTLSEIAYALQCEKPVIGYRSWHINGMLQADSVEAVMNAINQHFHG